VALVRYTLLLLYLAAAVLITSACASQWSCQYDNSHDSRISCRLNGVGKFETELEPPSLDGVLEDERSDPYAFPDDEIKGRNPLEVVDSN
jgi:hypothetical protein